MINLTLKQLRYVEALARHGHFGRAADACAISQPALSMQIKELEERLIPLRPALRNVVTGAV
jgi:LysR family transcriptional regulator, hydrogen peroxide-inducible genes activator